MGFVVFYFVMVYVGLLAILIKGGEGIARALLLLLLRRRLVLLRQGARWALVKALLPLRLLLRLALRLMSVPRAERLRLTSWGGLLYVEARNELLHRLTDRGGVVMRVFLVDDVTPCAAVLIEGTDNWVCVHHYVEVVEGDLVLGKSHCCCYCCLLLQGHQILRRRAIQFYVNLRRYSKNFVYFVFCLVLFFRGSGAKQ